MILIILIVGVLLFLGLVVVLVFAGVFKTESDQKKAEKNADSILDATFDGRPDVSYNTTMVSLKHETVVLGAKQRGYKLVNQNTSQYGYGTLIFEKVAATE